ncbi:hypothetical protein L2E82_11927 [Cichorium intybus]|uniref:Uncharacterized protein n=1 Tax=Cichorium intybus TaxID=13427 RepID=A0ACB9GE53_CICIN|nr:hypothetical protein L2E82_11927 [Cichorium intybus]
MFKHRVLGGNNGGDDSNKRSRNPEVNANPPKSKPPPTAVSRTTDINIFYKTRLCFRFLKGKCPNGDGCNYAHGFTDLRQPPPNSQEHVKNNRGWRKSNDNMKIVAQKFRGETAMEMGRTSESTVTNVPNVVHRLQETEARGFAKLANKNLKVIYGDWIDEE